MKPSHYLTKHVKTARDRARIKDYLLDMYLSEAEVEKAVIALNLGKGGKDGKETKFF